MKKYLNFKTILLIISILIVLAGAITLCVVGFEKDIEYKAGTRIEVYIHDGFEKEEILEIAKESFDTNEILFSEIEKLNQVAGIKVAKYSQEQLDTYIDKIMEKYEIDKEEKEYHEIVVPETKISTIITPYILPLSIITVLSLIYVIIKNYKLNNKIKISLKVLGILVITLCVYLSFILILRLPFSIYTMPLALAIYIVTLLATLNNKCE